MISLLIGWAAEITLHYEPIHHTIRRQKRKPARSNPLLKASPSEQENDYGQFNATDSDTSTYTLSQQARYGVLVLAFVAEDFFSPVVSPDAVLTGIKRFYRAAHPFTRNDTTPRERRTSAKRRTFYYAS